MVGTADMSAEGTSELRQAAFGTSGDTGPRWKQGHTLPGLRNPPSTLSLGVPVSFLASKKAGEGSPTLGITGCRLRVASKAGSPLKELWASAGGRSGAGGRSHFNFTSPCL